MLKAVSGNPWPLLSVTPLKVTIAFCPSLTPAKSLLHAPESACIDTIVKGLNLFFY